MEAHDNSLPATNPSMRDVAARAGVSLSAVSLVINERPGVGAAKRALVQAAMADLGYVRSGRQSVTPERKVLGLLMESLSQPANNDGFYTRIVSGIEDAAERQGYRLLLHRYWPGRDPVGDIRSLMGRDIDGIIVANDGDVNTNVILQIAATGIPVVLVENYLLSPIHAVTADNFVAGLIMTKHLLELGHHRIAAIRGPDKYSSLRDRLRGHNVALLEGGLVIDPLLQPPAMLGHPKKGYAEMQQLLALPDRPTAVFAVSDKSAFGAIDAIRDAGLGIPEDISIVGIDDVAESAYSAPPLTTFHVPKYKLGETAVAILHDLVSTAHQVPAKTVLIGEMVVRSSTAAPR
ncbi:MAG: LacI family DNA-binding transcriptional regulator [Herpetosiphon sp.]